MLQLCNIKRMESVEFYNWGRRHLSPWHASSHVTVCITPPCSQALATMSACIESHFCLFACSDTSTVSYCKSQRSPPSGTYIKYPTRRIKLHASSDLYFIQHRVSYWNKSQTATQCSSADTSAILHHLPMVALRNMQTFSHSFGRKRLLSPEVYCNRNFEGKRRATTNHKPILQVDTMLQMDKMLPYRRTPEQSFFLRMSPFLS
jgi:hypothetical protein